MAMIFPSWRGGRSAPTGQIAFHLNAETGHSCLCLEWFSQNGRITLAIPNPVIELLSDDEEDDDHPDLALFDGNDCDPELDDDEDQFGLFNSELLDEFDSAAEALDQEIFAASDDGALAGIDPAFPTDPEELEKLIESTAGVPIATIFDPPLTLPLPGKIPAGQAEEYLKRLLARLAEHGVALDVCEHYSPEEVYELLIDDILPFELTHPDLFGNNWIQHLSTSDHCADCEEEMGQREDDELEREIGEYERNRPGEEEEED